MTTNFNNSDCDEVLLGAKRYNPLEPPAIKRDEEEEYAERTYTERLNYEEAESTARIEALKELAEEVNKDPSEGSHVNATNTHKGLHSRITIDALKGEVELISEFGRIEDFCGIKETRIGSGKGDPEGDIPPELYELGVRKHRHPRTIRAYVATLLAFFSNIETEFINKDGVVFIKKLPVFYASKEKLVSISEHQFKELTNGNTNFIPRASLILDSMEYDSTRQINKSLAVAKEVTMDSLKGARPYAEMTPAPSPYTFSCRMNILTRGIDDALMIAEQIGAFFNPFYIITMVDNAFGGDSQIRIKLEGITFEPAEVEDTSQNEVLTEILFTVYGNLYKGKTKEYLAERITVNISS